MSLFCLERPSLTRRIMRYFKVKAWGLELGNQLQHLSAYLPTILSNNFSIEAQKGLELGRRTAKNPNIFGTQKTILGAFICSKKNSSELRNPNFSNDVFVGSSMESPSTGLRTKSMTLLRRAGSSCTAASPDICHRHSI